MRGTMFQIHCFGISDIGLVREHNEDVWVAHPEEGLFILADGMGGHAAGEVAAKESVDYLYDLFQKSKTSNEKSVEEVCKLFKDALQEVNTAVYKEGKADKNLEGMGTTICVLYLHHSEAILVHVGDSRIYRLRHQTLKQLTEDHSLVSELIAVGAVKSEEANTFPYKHILTRAIGTQPKVEPTVSSVTIESNDLFMLCSDGLTNYVKDHEIQEILSTSHSLEEKGKQLVHLANEHGGGDNITLILITLH